MKSMHQISMMNIMLICITWSFFFKQSPGELSHPALIVQWKINVYKADYEEQETEKNKPSEKQINNYYNSDQFPESITQNNVGSYFRVF